MKTKTQTTETNMKTASYMDIQMDADKHYFEMFPKARSYSRKPFNNEINQCLLVDFRRPKEVEVINHGQGLRVKRFVF